MRNHNRTIILVLATFILCVFISDFYRAKADDSSKAKAEFECPASDSVFTYDIISRVTKLPNAFRIIERRNFACLMHSSTNGDYEWVGGIAPYYGKDNDSSAVLAHDLWPLQVGKHVETQNPWYRIDFDVMSFGRVDVPLGRYEAFEIRESYWHHDYKLIRTIYWSPHFKWVIKQEEHMVFGTSPAGLSNWALETVSLP